MADLDLHPPRPRSNAFLAAPPYCGSTGAEARRGGGGCGRGLMPAARAMNIFGRSAVADLLPWRTFCRCGPFAVVGRLP